MADRVVPTAGGPGGVTPTSHTYDAASQVTGFTYDDLGRLTADATRTYVWDLASRLTGAPLVLFDGTLWHDAEMVEAGIGVKSGQRMGHISMSGPDGTMAAFQDLGVARKVFIHINNSNPVLLEDSPERASVKAAGWDVAFDGMEISL